MNKLGSYIITFDGISTFSSHPGVIVWTGDDRIKVSKVVPGTTDEVETVFDVPVSDIESFGGYNAILTFIIDGKKRMIDFNPVARTSLVFGGMLGLLLAEKATAVSGIRDWTAALSAAGVKNKFTTTGKIILWTLPVFGVIMIGSVIWAVASTLL